MKPQEKFSGDGHAAGESLYAAPPIGEKIIHQLPEVFTRREFMECVCTRGLAYDYGWNLLLDLVRSQTIVCIEPDKFKSNLKPKKNKNLP